MQTTMLSSWLLKAVKKLSPNGKLILAEIMFGSGLERDNYGQFLVYTGYIIDRKTNRVRGMKEEDSE